MQLVFDRVTKFYGPVIGVNEITCRFEPGITGLLGANGAGKSTLMKLASGQLRPSLGDVRLGEDRAWSTAAKRRLGYCPDANTFYEEMTGREFVTAMAGLYGYRHHEVRERTQRALEQVGMADLSGRRLGGCSHGMRQRIKLAQALVNDPAILLLDEPLSGIDPGGRRDINELLIELATDGKTIVVSSHILEEIEQLADVIVMIARGRLIASGTLAEIRNLLDDCPQIVAIGSRDARRLATLLVKLPEVLSVSFEATDGNAVNGDAVLQVHTHQPARFFMAVNELALAERIDIRSLETLDAGADAVFGYLERGSS
jgi:ABC-2 type transport system ATP-binding protein